MNVSRGTYPLAKNMPDIKLYDYQRPPLMNMKEIAGGTYFSPKRGSKDIVPWVDEDLISIMWDKDKNIRHVRYIYRDGTYKEIFVAPV
jgi:hypothetical protein